MSSLLVVGSVAFDTLHNAQGTHEKVIGGSATYASISSSFFANTQLVGVVGNDFPESAIETMRTRKIDLEGLEVADGLTFHWEGRYTDDLTSRETLRTDLNVFADFAPKIPERFRSTPYVMLGNIAPSLQISVLDQIESPKLVIADTMNFWIDGALDDLKALLKRVDVLVINEEEARQLSGRHHLVHVLNALTELGPRCLVVKQGEYGAILFTEDTIFSAPAYPLAAIDPTGAGDTFAGGFLGYIAREGEITQASLRQAVVHGSAMASFCVEGIGPDRLLEISDADVAARVGEFRQLVDFG
ncbi:MAG: PfkB family carbohydrate kinase [Myxococcota bacterium]